MTIAAIATALGEGGIGIIRISGEQSLTIARKIFRSAGSKALADHINTLIYGKVVDENEQAVDEVLAVYMRAPHSYTAEDVVELQCHGSIASLSKILELTLLNGARLAEPGEFTKRAFLNGRLDLSQAEAVMDIIKARSQSSLKLAMRQHRGLLSQKISSLRNILKDIIVQIEAVIDYPEEDIEDITTEQITADIATVKQQLAALSGSYKVGQLLKDGLRVVIAGKPNVGKSSLLNFLLKEERAIVSEIAGTTRDVIEERVMVGNIPIVLVDTAGIRSAQDSIEKIGVERSWKNLKQADLVLLVLDAQSRLEDDELQLIETLKEEQYFILINKIDLQQDALSAELKKYTHITPIYISAVTGAGMEEFSDKLEKFVCGNAQLNLDDNLYVQNSRHYMLLTSAIAYIADAEQALSMNISLDCVTIDIKGALEQLGMITGDTVSDEIIQEIFARFCIGK